MSRVHISNEVLEWALERSGRRNRIEARFPTGEWLSGEKEPTVRQLERFARETRTPLGYLFLPRPPRDQLPIPYFRTLSEEPVTPSADLLETVHAMQRRQSWMREHLIEEGFGPLHFVASARASDDPKAIAQAIRLELCLDGGWAANQPNWTEALKNLRNRIEDAGMLVVVNGVVGNNTHRTLDPSEFRGFVLVDDYAPLVFVNGADGKAAQMFTLAHEVAHVWLGSSAAFDLREMQPGNNATEKACNQVAAEFLVPSEELRLFHSALEDRQDYQAIARHFKVSEVVAARRCLDLRFISSAGFSEFYDEYRKREYAKPASDGGDFYSNQNSRVGRRFGAAIYQAVVEGSLLYHEAYQLTGLHGKVFDEYMSGLELGRVA